MKAPGLNPFNYDIKQMQAAQGYAFGGGQKAGGVGGVEGRKYAGGTEQAGIALAGEIGMAKREGFLNGVGGTNDRGNHKLFEIW